MREDTELCLKWQRFSLYSWFSDLTDTMNPRQNILKNSFTPQSFLKTGTQFLKLHIQDWRSGKMGKVEKESAT